MNGKFDRKYKWNVTHKAIKIIHEMYDRNMATKPDESLGEYKLLCLMYWLTLFDSINISNADECIDSRLSIMGLLVDNNLVPIEDRLPLSHSWSHLTDVPWKEFVDACVDLWREIKGKKDQADKYLRALGDPPTDVARDEQIQTDPFEKLSGGDPIHWNRVSEKKLINNRFI